MTNEQTSELAGAVVVAAAPMASWLFLLGAIGAEVTGTTFMKLSDGFTNMTAAALMVVFYGISFAALTFAIKHIEVGVAYAIWSGLGTALIAVIGLAFFQETFSALKALSILLVIVGVAGLNLSAQLH